MPGTIQTGDTFLREFLIEEVGKCDRLANRTGGRERMRLCPSKKDLVAWKFGGTNTQEGECYPRVVCVG